MQFKYWLSNMGLMSSIFASATVLANPTHDAMQALALETATINQTLSQHSPIYANMLAKEGGQGHVVGLKDVIGLEYQGLEVIARRSGAGSLQYERVKGEALPFFILVRNTTDQPIQFKPADVRLMVNGKSMKPAGNRRLEAILKKTNQKQASFAEMVGKVLVVAKTSKVLVNGGAFKLITNTASTLNAVGVDGLHDSIRETMKTTKGFEELNALAESEIAAQFKAGDEFLLHHADLSLQKNQMTTFNLFFEDVPSDQLSMQLDIPIHQPNVQYKFKYLDPNQSTF